MLNDLKIGVNKYKNPIVTTLWKTYLFDIVVIKSQEYIVLGQYGKNASVYDLKIKDSCRMPNDTECSIIGRIVL